MVPRLTMHLQFLATRNGLRNLTLTSSHRSLFAGIRISIDEEFAAKSLFHSCEVMLVERLPSGVFADPFELQHIQDRGVYGEVAVFGDTNLELPSFLSNRTLVEVHMFFSPDGLLEQKHGLEIKVEVPLHACYQPLDGSGYSAVQFGEPDVFARCRMEKRSSNQSHLFVLTSNGAISYKNPTVWKIPSGVETHAGFVSIVTFLSASLSALVIIVASVFHSNIKLHENVKIS
ncbi:phosphatidylinositol-glycan biosynthesis class X protein isoform X2 [Rhodamnia argentea]|uniref:Phosphatidylinositol-glycan biosynthesis class X protein isoform X2 n=1 Tax=Rhodamnia argentea TaxID=178133 RepID=A0ABM3H563_9MYRT|nr:phosphatidylinositol-glycan biosynthesis class X protein isoform X2 [Rhodamnia argentea]